MKSRPYITVWETDRLLLSQLNNHDAAFMLQLINSSSWIKYIGDRKIRTIKKVQAYIQKSYVKDYHKGIGLFCVRLKCCGTPIGTCGLIDRGTLPFPDIGFALLDQYAGKGYILEAGKLILNKSRELLLVDKVCGITVPYNPRSINTLKSLGFKQKKKIILDDDDEELLYFESK